LLRQRLVELLSVADVAALRRARDEVQLTAVDRLVRALAGAFERHRLVAVAVQGMAARAAGREAAGREAECLRATDVFARDRWGKAETAMKGNPGSCHAQDR
jgi:hypothetical protein